MPSIDGSDDRYPRVMCEGCECYEAEMEHNGYMVCQDCYQTMLDILEGEKNDR